MIERCTDELEQQLITASTMDIAIGDTAVGRYEQKRMEDFQQSAPKFMDEQWSIMNVEREQHATNQGLGGDHRRVVGGPPIIIIISLKLLFYH
jgi:hypothetical protein